MNGIWNGLQKGLKQGKVNFFMYSFLCIHIFMLYCLRARHLIIA